LHHEQPPEQQRVPPVNQSQELSFDMLPQISKQLPLAAHQVLSEDLLEADLSSL
jgi:hypothetical protein